jgi:RND family efflux transporter MFP subunit
VSEQEWEDANAEYLQALANANLARAQVRTAEIRLRYTDVLAPISGRIGKSSCTQGSLVTANQPAELAVIQQLDPVYVDMTQSSLNILKIRERISRGTLVPPAGGSARVQARLETGALYEAEGELKFSDITVDEGTGMVLLRAVFPNPEGVLLPGMYVRALVNVGVQKNALLVPQLAVRRNAKGVASVFVASSANEAEERIVEAQERAGAFWIVSSGLKAGEKVIVSSLQSIRHGTPLKVAEIKTLKALLDEAKAREGASGAPGQASAEHQ